MFRESKRAAILELHKLGHSIHRIARTFCASRITVRRIVTSDTSQVPKILRPNSAEPYRTQILELCSRCCGNLRLVHKNLIARGAHFSYSSLTSFVRRNRIRAADATPSHSLSAAQQWLAEIAHGSRPSEILNTEANASSDLATLVYSLRNGRIRERKQAATILARKRGIPNTIISVVLHSSPKTTRHYYKLYSDGGLAALFGPCTHQQTTQTGDSEKTRNLLEILHQKPTAFGANRTSWTQRLLIQAYKKQYQENISRSTVARLFKTAGYRWRKARRVLTSPDPHYREKLELLLKTLTSLASTELLFFLDEWGPVQVRKRGGKTYSTKDNLPRVPRHQASRGTVSLVAALSATANQLSWTFITSKDSRSMTDLLETLYNQYHASSKLYVTWDAVSWHNSATLTDWLDEFNLTTRQSGGGPLIELVPLPTSAQFLNVIEGVLSGMTRAVINNSDYSSAEDMKVAISTHFTERNQRFRDNPRRAGKAIWEADFFHGLDAFTNGLAE